MKHTVCFLVLVILIGLGISISSSYTQPRVIKGNKASGRVVFVNLDDIVPLHPSYEAILELQAAIGNTCNPDNEPDLLDKPSAAHCFNDNLPIMTFNETRRRLQDFAVAKSISAIDELEYNETQALIASLAANREIMLESKRNELLIKEQEINRGSEERLRSLAQNYSNEIINAKLKYFALGSIKPLPGSGESLISSRFSNAVTELKRLENLVADESRKINENAASELLAIRNGLISSIDEAILNIGNEERDKIKKRAYNARIETALDIKSSAKAQQNKTYAGAMKIIADTRRFDPSMENKRLAINRLNIDFSLLKFLIVKDTKRVLVELANKNGLQIVFKRSNKYIPDRTNEFKKMLSCKADLLFEPVLSKAGI